MGEKNEKEMKKSKKYQSMKNIPKKTKKAIDRINPLKKKIKRVKMRNGETSFTDLAPPAPSKMVNGDQLHKTLQELDILSDDEDDDESIIMSKNKNNPWFNEDIASIVKLCRKYRRKHHKSKTKKNELKQICKDLEKRKRFD